jgi:hypothetical protein
MRLDHRLGPRCYDPGPYDDDWEDQPAQSGFHKWFLGVAVPLGLVGYGVWVLATGEAGMQGRGMSAVLRGGREALRQLGNEGKRS